MTKFDPTAISFDETDVPVVAKETGPNMFDGKFPTADGKALVMTVPGDAKGEAVKTITRHARAEAHKHEKSARVKVENVGTEKTPKSKVTVWTTARITRPRTTDEANSQDAAADAAAAE